MVNHFRTRFPKVKGIILDKDFIPRLESNNTPLDIISSAYASGITEEEIKLTYKLDDKDIMIYNRFMYCLFLRTWKDLGIKTKPYTISTDLCVKNFILYPDKENKLQEKWA